MAEKPAKKPLPACVVQHDLFNLVCVFALIALTVVFLATERYFPWLWWGMQGYLVVDIAWVLLVPKSVKGPSAIIVHHIITMLFIMVPFYHPEYNSMMGLNMLVEINTWLLIVKRHVKHNLLEALFYGTWVVMRLMVYPYLVVVYANMYLRAAEKTGNYYTTILVLAPIIQFVLSSMNVWWTVTMLTQLAARRRAGRAGVTPTGKEE